MTNQFSVKPFQAGKDSPDEIAATHLKIRQWEERVGQADFSGRILSSQKDLKSLNRYYVAAGGNFFIAKDTEGRLIGFVGLKNNGDGHGAFKRLAVVPEWQRKGVGKALVSVAIDWARAAGFTKLSLQTHSREYAKSLYEQFGFKVVGWVDELEDWLMERRL
ncbi:MAG TPA: GNAT family N-acetyltransferase [Candidatus Saccharimonadales bacterium]|nr:GNAT family N-acetyltransferase [Candidatus Saccharimonadales bacterium]